MVEANGSFDIGSTYSDFKARFALVLGLAALVGLS